MNLLYVEDNPMDVDLVTRELARSAPAIHLDVAGTLGEAQRRLLGGDDRRYDIVLTDRRLPDGDGLSLLVLIRERHLPVAVVIVTGSGDEEFVVSALKAGADDYIIKGGDYLARLPNALTSALENYRRAVTRQTRALRVLYAEHHTQDVDLTLRHLARHAPHIHVRVAHTAAEALSRLPHAAPVTDVDVLLTDLRLPGMGGLELLKELREVRNLDLPVVLITGQGDEETALLALKLGATEYLPKHANYLNRLPTTLENAFQRVELAREHAALRESAARLKEAQALGRIGNWGYDIRRQTLTWSDQMYTLYGRDLALGPPTVEEDAAYYSPQQMHVLREYERRAIAEGASFDYDLEAHLPDGRTAFFAGSMRSVKDHEGRVVRLFGTVQDITERKLEAERLELLVTELARSNVELERFAYIASHDLQEPLRMVSSFVQLLAQRYRGQLDADADEFIGYAVEGAQRMSQLILDLLAFSRVGTRGQSFEPTDCEAVLAQVARGLGEEIAVAQAQITHDPLPTVAADRAQLAQLLSHLIFNALKFRSADPPRVHVSARAMDDVPSTMDDGRSTMDDGRSAHIEHRPSNIEHRPSGWVFSVRDNGIGIAPQYHEEIFRAFRRLHTRLVYQGNGIGLAISKKIVERHGGRMWVESQEGAGATFYFTLPAQ
jgi:signal transduction histidine kinase